MRRNEAIQRLTEIKPELEQKFGITRLALFGSTARDAAQAGSDIDILVTFDSPANSARFFGAQFYLEDTLGCPIDLVTEKALRKELRPYVESEVIYV